MRFKKLLIIVLVVCLSAMLTWLLWPRATVLKNPPKAPDKRSELFDFNQKRFQMEEQMIKNFIEEEAWEMETTGTGLRIRKDSIVENPVYANHLDLVVFNYTCQRLNGDTIYNSADDGVGYVRIGKDESIPALHQALPKIGLGEKATIIIPSHLAHGLHGDDKKIGAWETLIYTIEIKEIIKKNE